MRCSERVATRSGSPAVGRAQSRAGQCRTSSISSGVSAADTELIVVDASVVAEAVLARDGLRVLERHDAVAPPLLWSETVSVLREAVWRRELEPAEARGGLDRLLASGIQRRAPARLYVEALEIARELGWAKTYDAEYVALARILGSPLVTRDGRLASRVGDLVTIVAPADL